jgi:hypothetical protein
MNCLCHGTFHTRSWDEATAIGTSALWKLLYVFAGDFEFDSHMAQAASMTQIGYDGFSSLGLGLRKCAPNNEKANILKPLWKWMPFKDYE